MKRVKSKRIFLRNINKTFLLAALVTSLSFFAHIITLFYQSKMIIDVWVVPFWINGLLAIITIYLSAYFWRNVLK
tara:strand:+ start:1506 stop:1730 length:225 start_codon:yes stop_codon:yes gene_type:complete